jgi:hypothetical protein
MFYSVVDEDSNSLEYQGIFSHLIDPEDGGRKFLRSVGSCTSGQSVISLRTCEAIAYIQN